MSPSKSETLVIPRVPLQVFADPLGRVPALGEVTDPTGAAARAQRRRIARGRARCHRCRQVLSTTDELCLDDGKDSHRACSEGRNTVIAGAVAELAAQDDAEQRQAVEQLGLVVVGR